MHKQGACLRVIGDRARLPADIVALIEQAENITRDNSAITVVLALSYGGRHDILQAAKELARLAAEKSIDLDKISEESFAGLLMTRGIPDPDLVIRTSGEHRVSNFLMWQMAYAEIFFTRTLWPDFSKKDMEEAVAFYASRDRRFGGLPQQAKAGEG
jgi:undecaprenyl diphosphate synthase